MVRRDQGAEALEAGREVAYMQQEERRDPVAVQPETGETSGMKAASVRPLLFRARKKLLDLIGESGRDHRQDPGKARS